MAKLWTEDCDKAFEDLKKAITTTPVLAINDPELPYVLQTDASDKALGGVLMQIRPDGNRVVIAYLHHKFNKVERRWPIHERELYALYYSLGKCRHYLIVILAMYSALVHTVLDPQIVTLDPSSANS